MESKLFKRLFSMCIVVALVLSMCPTFVFAESTAAQPEALNLDPDGNGCPHCEGAVEWQAWNATNVAAGGHYKLTANVSRTSAITTAPRSAREVNTSSASS